LQEPKVGEANGLGVVEKPRNCESPIIENTSCFIQQIKTKPSLHQLGKRAMF